MRKILCFLIPLLFVSCLGEKEMNTTVETQADELGRYYKEGYYQRYLECMAYFVYANKDERNQLKAVLEKEREDFQAHNNSVIENVSSHLHSEIMENDGYYQCVIKQDLLVKSDLTTFETHKYLLAISQDGETWKFADVTNYSEDMIRAVFPEMHPKLQFKKEM